MTFSEFDIIDNFFSNLGKSRTDVVLGVGDDCALLSVPEGYELAISMDTLVAGVHFLPTANPYDLGYKALAVNLSDLAAMGAEPAWVTCSLTIPTVEEKWLKDFAAGLNELLTQYHLQLVGGDLSHGPMSITIQVHGFVPKKLALRRDAAKVGDIIYVTGKLGAAALALQGLLQRIPIAANDFAALRKSLDRPTARIAEGLKLRGVAHAAIDISDGIAADLNHILRQSKVGATIMLVDLPVEPLLTKYLSTDEAYSLALSGGEDYELCFTVPKENESVLAGIQQELDTVFYRIGNIEATSGLRIHDDQGKPFVIPELGYQHF